MFKVFPLRARMFILLFKTESQLDLLPLLTPAVLVSAFVHSGILAWKSIFSREEKCDNAPDAFQVLPFQIELAPSSAKRKESASFILLGGWPSALGGDIDDKKNRERRG